MKTVRIRNTAVATDIVVCEIYHTNNPAEGPSILMSSSVSQSGQFTGDDLYNGIEFQVPDEVSQFYVKNIDRCINIGSGSLTESSTVVEYFTVYPGSGERKSRRVLPSKSGKNSSRTRSRPLQR